MRKIFKLSFFLIIYFVSIVYLSSTDLSNIDNNFNTPEEFEELGVIAKAKGFLLVSSSPLTRSSYHADEDFAKLQQNRNNFH